MCMHVEVCSLITANECVRVYVHVYPRVYVSVYVRMYIRMYVYKNSHVTLCVRVQAYVCLHTYSCIHDCIRKRL